MAVTESRRSLPQQLLPGLLFGLLVFIALTLITPITQTVRVAMAMTEGSTISPHHLQMAASLLTVAVPLLFFLLLERYFIRGVLAGALKG